MVRKNLIISFFIVWIVNCSLPAQERLRPGFIYQAGDSISAPRLGLTSIIPEKWAGVLPQDTEMFLLMSTDHPQSSIYAFAFDDTKDELRERWTSGPGLEVENSIKLVRSSEVFDRGDVIAAELKVENSTNNSLGYIEAKCSEFDKCLVLLLVVPEQFYEDSQKGLISFMDNSILTEPSIGDIYEDFDWNEFFGKKYLATRQVNPYEKAKRQNQIWFCPDGTFRSNIKVKGFANIPKKIKGDRSGTWEADGIGPEGTLTLTFKKLDEPVSLPARLQDDKIYINDIQYFVMQNNSCK